MATSTGSPEFTNTNFDVIQGEPFTLRFVNCDAGCTIELVSGSASSLSTLSTLATGAVDSAVLTLQDLPEGQYAFSITSEESGQQNYSPLFLLEEDASDGNESTETSSTTSILIPSTTITERESTTSQPEPTSTASQADSSTSTTTTSEIPSTLELSSIPITTTTPVISSSNVPPPPGGRNGSNNSDDGLATGTLVGIVVGSVLGFILIVAVLGFWWWKRRNRIVTSGLAPRHDSSSQLGTAELEQPKGLASQGTYFVGAETPGPTSPPAWELHSDARPAELTEKTSVPVSELYGHPGAAELDSEGPTAPGLRDQNKPAHSDKGSELAPCTVTDLPSPSSPFNEPRSGDPSILSGATAATGSLQSLETASTSMPKGLPTGNAQDKGELMQQYSQLEARRRRLLELEKIEEEQARLQQQLKSLPSEL
ncbi:hypothetical protein S40293_05596 [Stachybotrys chartarum IBT 40293]|nr:hypothetical protein S40293_05596 [Stachybotrys chartarum IBT 40293]